MNSNPCSDLLGSSAGFDSRRLAASPPKTVSKNWYDLPADDLHCSWIDDVGELIEIAPLWKRLAECCLCPNVFYEPQLLIPAWTHLRQGNIRIAVVRATQRSSKTQEPVLCGLFPLEINNGLAGLPFKTAKLWQHIHCFLNTPLVRSDVAVQTFDRLFQFLQSDSQRIGMLHLNHVSAEGPFHDALVELFQISAWTCQVKAISRRAMFVRKQTSEDYLSAWPRKKRHEISRLERRLSESGSLTLDEFQFGDDVEAWADRFLAFEALGWKGKQGTAMSVCPAQAAFLKECLFELASENRFMGLTLNYNGEPIAMKTNFLTHDGGFAFKIAYHPDWAKYSPGTILEKVNITKLHEHPRLLWMDSCAAPNHSMIDSLWPERRLIQSVAVSLGRRGSDSALALLPLMKFARDRVRRLLSRA